MIRISKPATGPRILSNSTSRGPKETQRLKDAYDAGRRNFTSDDFKSDIYGAKSVKNALKKAQYDKCCFCESKVTHVAYGDVEHFRPKAGYRQEEADELGKPGYYWLAYEWRNLFFSCQLCNQRYKKNLFPLADPDDRALSHHDEVADEEPLFIDPAAEDPADYIAFREEYVYAIDGNARGQRTIEALGLERNELEEIRRDRLAKLKTKIRTVRVLTDMVNDRTDPLPPEAQALLLDLRGELNEMKKDSAEYSSMARAALAILHM